MGHRGAAARREPLGVALHLDRGRHPLRAGRGQERRAERGRARIEAARADGRRRSATCSTSRPRAERGALNRRVLESLVQAGACDALGADARACSPRVRLGARAGRAPPGSETARGQSSLFGGGADATRGARRRRCPRPSRGARASARRRRRRCSASTSPSTRSSRCAGAEIAHLRHRASSPTSAAGRPARRCARSAWSASAQALADQEGQPDGASARSRTCRARVECWSSPRPTSVRQPWPTTRSSWVRAGSRRARARAPSWCRGGAPLRRRAALAGFYVRFRAQVDEARARLTGSSRPHRALPVSEELTEPDGTTSCCSGRYRVAWHAARRVRRRGRSGPPHRSRPMATAPPAPSEPSASRTRRGRGGRGRAVVAPLSPRRVAPARRRVALGAQRTCCTADRGWISRSRLELEQKIPELREHARRARARRRRRAGRARARRPRSCGARSTPT